jgi:hypothetical protein
MRAYSIDLRARVLMDWDAGLGTNAVARKFRVSAARRLKWRRRRKEAVNWLVHHRPRQFVVGIKPWFLRFASPTRRLR